MVEVDLGKLWIEGEVSNLKKQASGHWYFSLKDDHSQIQCVIFHARNREGSDFLEDGAKVKTFAETTVYEARGQLQVIVEKVENAGLGDLQARFEALKKKLQLEGLFDSSRKQKLPFFPKVIGIVTSPTGAAIQDIFSVLERRAPWIQTILYPVRVQGKGSENEIAKAIRDLNRTDSFEHPACDLLIVGRGGGSLEDLWAFNEEAVARAMAASHIPIISAVGHEIDFTIADFVADLRAPTPSAAAELAVPDIQELLAHFQNLKHRLDRNLKQLLREPIQNLDLLHQDLLRGMKSTLEEKQKRLQEQMMRLRYLHPEQVLERRADKLDSLNKYLETSVNQKLKNLSARLSHYETLLRSLGPESILKRGYSITTRADGTIINGCQSLINGEIIHTKMIDGELISKVFS